MALPSGALIPLNLPIIVIQLLGLTLYLFGSINELARPSALFASILLVIWGFFTSLYVWAIHNYWMWKVGEGITTSVPATVFSETYARLFEGVLWIIGGLAILVHALKS